MLSSSFLLEFGTSGWRTGLSSTCTAVVTCAKAQEEGRYPVPGNGAPKGNPCLADGTHSGASDCRVPVYLKVRKNYHQASEAAVNHQVHLELSASHVQLSMSYYLDSDDAALKNFAKYFSLMRSGNVRGIFNVLGQLTETGVVNPEQFMKSFEHMKKSGDYYVTVVEDVTLGQIVATATLIIEHKFIHSCAKRGRVEDVISDECRGRQLGKLLLSTLTLLSKKLNCYKITLECLPENVGFYKKCGYTVSEENYMCRRFLQ
ncbi:Glucosamine 6-phosphate N-acetyltransferase [Sciurus carolinensis]|uniref:Glucosamine 6-phosphate N-acetyltransferase n=1 Tax=Sciurus carolinensis TaxID=30640 RepID=A0AA41STF9_SCICA|nr:Glucosamine 6-phosphate N-acetyltransferase [Sciurus carolinensis]